MATCSAWFRSPGDGSGVPYGISSDDSNGEHCARNSDESLTASENAPRALTPAKNDGKSYDASGAKVADRNWGHKGWATYTPCKNPAHSTVRYDCTDDWQYAPAPDGRPLQGGLCSKK